MPEDSTVEDISNAYIESWRLGLEAVAIYRENSKRLQPLSTGKSERAAQVPATAIRFSLQYGVPLKFLVDNFRHVRIESGESGNLRPTEPELQQSPPFGPAPRPW